MSEWITDRLPTEADSDILNKVWITENGFVYSADYTTVEVNQPWMPIKEPNPYVKPEQQRWKPQYGDEYYAIKSSGLIAHSIFHNGFYEDCTYNFGNCFETREQAQEAARRVRETLLNYHKEMNNE